MSNDPLVLSIEEHARALQPLIPNAPLYAALAVCEDEGTDPPRPPSLGLADYVRVTSGPVEVVQELPFSSGADDRTYALTVYADQADTDGREAAALQAFLPVASNLARVVSGLPADTLARLGLPSALGTSPGDWLWALFHLGWHFPE